MKYNYSQVFARPLDSSEYSNKEPPQPHEIDQLSENKKKSRCRKVMETMDIKANATNLRPTFMLGPKERFRLVSVRLERSFLSWLLELSLVMYW